MSASGVVVVVGSINVDTVVTAGRLPRPGETLIGSTVSTSPGGKGANQAVAAARCGARTLMVGSVGDDGQSGTALSGLDAADVDTSRVATVAGPTGQAFITVGADDGENTIVVVPGANASVTRDAVDGSSDILATAAIVVLQGEIPEAGILRATELTAGRVLLNLAPVIDLPEVALGAADPLVVNEHEARELAERMGLGAGDDAAVAGELLAHGPKSVVLTRGAAGALVVTAEGAVDVASPQVTAVDSSGAGDAFVGALAASLASGDGLVEATRYAVRVGAFAVTVSGAQLTEPIDLRTSLGESSV